MDILADLELTEEQRTFLTAALAARSDFTTDRERAIYAAGLLAVLASQGALAEAQAAHARELDDLKSQRAQAVKDAYEDRKSVV